MQVKQAMGVPAQAVDGAPGATIRWLWGAADAAPSFALRLIEVQAGGSTPHHAHPYEHQVYVLAGRARLRGDAREFSLEPGDTALVLPDERHQFVNLGADVLRFLCAVPLARGSAG